MPTSGRRVDARSLGAVLAGGLLIAGCSSGDDADERPPTPVVDQIDAAIDEVDAASGGLDFFEISADLEAVKLVTAAPLDGGEPNTFAAESWRYDDGELSGPEPLGDAQGQVFAADAVDFDADGIFDGIIDDLDNPVISDFAVTGTPDGVLYDATVLSDEGGVLAVQLSADGSVLAVQGT